MRRAWRLSLTVAALSVCFMSYSFSAMAEEKSLPDEQNHFLAEETTLEYQFPPIALLAQADTKKISADSSKEPANKSSAKKGRYTQAQINEMINNPLGELWLLWTQNDTSWYDGDALDFLGEDEKVFNTFTINPVLAMQFTENVKYIFRPVIPIHTWEVPSVTEGTPTHYPGGDLPFDVSFDRKTELGDIVLWNAFATNEMARTPNVMGFGFTAMLPTATNDDFGTQKWSAGPLVVALHVGPPKGFIFGGILQHWWSFAGDSDASNVNLTNFQYIGFWRANEEWSIGFSPNIVVDWEADSDQRWIIPVGIGVYKTHYFGELPIKLGFEGYKYVKQPDAFGPEWGLRFVFAPVVPSPGFAHNPIF